MRSALTSSVQKAVVAALREGLSYEAAAGCAGVSRASLFRWLERGERELERRELARDGDTTERAGREDTSALTERCVLFALAVRSAEAELERETLAPIAARTVRWQASAWRLERRFPRRYGVGGAREGAPIARSGVVILPPLDERSNASRNDTADAPGESP